MRPLPSTFKDDARLFPRVVGPMARIRQVEGEDLFTFAEHLSIVSCQRIGSARICITADENRSTTLGDLGIFRPDTSWTGVYRSMSAAVSLGMISAVFEYK